MANEKQVEILLQGVEAWNKWREENFDARIDLREVDLCPEAIKGRDVAGPDGRANLRLANLEGADLGGANLERADLLWARLEHAYLEGADLRRANLSSALAGAANLERADLRRANLKGALLFGANLERADLRDANLEAASLGGAHLSDAKLALARFGRGTSLHDIQYRDGHESLNDGAEELLVGWPKRPFSFGRAFDVLALSHLFRRILRLFPYGGEPVGWHLARPFAGGRRLEASVISAILAMGTVQTIHWLNRHGLTPLRRALGSVREAAEASLATLRDFAGEHPDLAEFSRSEGLETHLASIEESLANAVSSLPAKIPLPEDSRLILVVFFLLLAGTAIYRLFAPDSVKEYTETQWVAELRRPRLIYLRDKYSMGGLWWLFLPLQCGSYLFSVAGLVILGWVFLTNFYAALRLAWPAL